MKKQELLNKIESLFFEKTFSEVSLQDIADKLGIKKASLYYYFESKETMFNELLEYSFLNYYNFLEGILELNFENFIKKFIYYPFNKKNLFSIINQNGFCENKNFKANVGIKQKEIFKLINNNFSNKYSFSKEKTFIILSLLEDLGRKKCIFGNCIVDFENTLKEINLIFNK